MNGVTELPTIAPLGDALESRVSARSLLRAKNDLAPSAIYQYHPRILLRTIGNELNGALQ